MPYEKKLFINGKFFFILINLVLAWSCLFFSEVSHAKTNSWHVGVYIEQNGEFIASGAIKQSEWKWDPNQELWRGKLITIKITGSIGKVWKYFAISPLHGNYEISERTRKNAGLPAKVLLHGFSKVKKPGDLVLRKQIAVQSGTGKYFPFKAHDFFFDGAPLSSISFDASNSLGGITERGPFIHLYTNFAAPKKTGAPSPANPKALQKPSVDLHSGHLLERVKPAQDQLEHFLQQWIPEWMPLTAAALLRLLVLFSIFFIFAFMRSISNRKRIRVLSKDPIAMELEERSRSHAKIEGITRVIEKNSIIVLIIISIFLFLSFRSALENEPLFQIAWIVCIVAGWLAGKYLWVANSLFFGITMATLTISLPWILARMIVLYEHIFSVHPAVYPFPALRFSIVVIFGAVWWLLMRLTKRRCLLTKMFFWLGLLYLDLEKWRELEKVIEKLQGIKKAEPLDLAWLEANLAIHNGKKGKAKDILSHLPPSLRNDQLLLQLYMKEDEYSRIEERASKHNAEDATALLKKLPVTFQRNRILVTRLAKERKWDQVIEILHAMKNNKAIELLEELPQTSERDDHLIPLLYKSPYFEKIIEVLHPYGVEGGMVKIQALLPEEPARDQVMLFFLARHGEYDQIRTLIADLPTDRTISLLKMLPDNEERDVLLAEIWLGAGNVDAIIDYFKEQRLEDSIKIIEGMENGVTRDRVLARLHEMMGEYDQVVSYLERHYEQGVLPQDDVRRLAHGQRELGHQDRALETLEKAWTIEPTNEEILDELCQVCISFGTASTTLSKLSDETLNRLNADGLWTLIGYYQHFTENEMAKKAAEIAVSLRKDQRAAFFLGNVFEDEGHLRDAAEAYGAAGEKGMLPGALCFFQLEYFSSAIPILREIAKTDEKNTTASYHLGYALYRTGDCKGAIEAFQKADPLEEDHTLQRDITVLFGQLGKSAMGNQNYQEAIEYLDQGLKHAPQKGKEEREKIKEALSLCYYYLARNSLLAPDRDGDEAAQFLDKAHAYHAGTWRDLDFLKGLYFLKNQSAEKAMQTFSVLCKRFPKDSRCLFHKALAAAMGQHNDYAKKILRDLAAEKKNDSYSQRAKMLLGSIDLRQGNWEEAEKHLRDANSRP
jgi:tetratricopeptide (TPR) repeat protein